MTHKLAGLRAGDPETWAWLVREQGPGVHRYLTGFLGCAASRDDLFQEVFLRGFGRIRSGGGPTTDDGLRPWLLAVARNLLRDRARRRAVRGVRASPDVIENIPAPQPSPNQEAERMEEQETLRVLMARLPARRAEPLRLKRHGGLSYAEIGSVLDIPAGTMGSRLNEALRTLARQLRPRSVGEGGRHDR